MCWDFFFFFFFAGSPSFILIIVPLFFFGMWEPVKEERGAILWVPGIAGPA